MTRATIKITVLRPMCCLSLSSGGTGGLTRLHTCATRDKRDLSGRGPAEELRTKIGVLSVGIRPSAGGPAPCPEGQDLGTLCRAIDVHLLDVRAVPSRDL